MTQPTGLLQNHNFATDPFSLALGRNRWPSVRLLLVFRHAVGRRVRGLSARLFFPQPQQRQNHHGGQGDIDGQTHQDGLAVLQNLVYNALSFTPEGGTIRLSLSRGREFAVLRVEDTGSGIAEADLPHIFDQFFTNRAHETSSGMGLFIAKSIITEHGGTIDVASELGKGSIFTIRLPIME